MGKTFNNKLGEKIKHLRIEKDLTQDIVAKKLNIQRVSYSQIENGDRKVSAEELTKLSKVFNIPADVLLDLRKDFKVVLEKEDNSSQDEGIRISVPQKKLSKFKELLLYILNKVGSRPNIGETVIYKLLYFIDFDYYEKYEEQLIGATYVRNHYGPTPIEFKSIIEEMKEGKDLVKIKDQYFQYPQTKYLPIREPDLKDFSAQEIKLIDDVLEDLSYMNANAISEYSHNDVPWSTTEEGEVIDYEKVFYRDKPYSVRSYDDGDV